MTYPVIVNGARVRLSTPQWEALCALVALLARRKQTTFLLWVHIPRMSATQSMGRLPLSPREAGHPLHTMPAIQST